MPLAPAPLLLLGAIGLFSTAIPITAFLIGIQWIGPGRAATAATMEPAVTLALAAAVLGDRLSAGQWLGAALILAGVISLRLEPRAVHRRWPPVTHAHVAGLQPSVRRARLKIETGTRTRTVIEPNGKSREHGPDARTEGQPSAGVGADVRAATFGDQEAFERIYRAHVSRVHATRVPNGRERTGG